MPAGVTPPVLGLVPRSVSVSVSPWPPPATGAVDDEVGIVDVIHHGDGRAGGGVVVGHLPRRKGRRLDHDILGDAGDADVQIVDAVDDQQILLAAVGASGDREVALIPIGFDAPAARRVVGPGGDVQGVDAGLVDGIRDGVGVGVEAGNGAAAGVDALDAVEKDRRAEAVLGGHAVANVAGRRVPRAAELQRELAHAGGRLDIRDEGIDPAADLEVVFLIVAGHIVVADEVDDAVRRSHVETLDAGVAHRLRPGGDALDGNVRGAGPVAEDVGLGRNHQVQLIALRHAVERARDRGGRVAAVDEEVQHVRGRYGDVVGDSGVGAKGRDADLVPGVDDDGRNRRAGVGKTAGDIRLQQRRRSHCC